MQITEEEKTLKKKILSDCIPGYAFWTRNRVIVSNIYELADSIEAMNDYTFRYHVNDDNNKNDFALWILAVLNDDVLAKRLKGIRDRGIYLKEIRKRIEELESVVLK